MSSYGAKLPDPDSIDENGWFLFVGHNPSWATWECGNYYANPSNRFWKIMLESKIVPTDIRLPADDWMVENRSIGFTDFLEHPDNDASSVKLLQMRTNIPIFAKRIGEYASSINKPLKGICFIGKRQFTHQFTPVLKSCPHGRIDKQIRPKLWPDWMKDLDIWVLPSPSGRSVMSMSERVRFYSDFNDSAASTQQK